MESALGPEPQICSHIRTQPLTNCETQGILTSPSKWGQEQALPPWTLQD